MLQQQDLKAELLCLRDPLPPLLATMTSWPSFSSEVLSDWAMSLISATLLRSVISQAVLRIPYLHLRACQRDAGTRRSRRFQRSIGPAEDHVLFVHHMIRLSGFSTRRHSVEKSCLVSGQDSSRVFPSAGLVAQPLL